MRKIIQIFRGGDKYDCALCDDGTAWRWSDNTWERWTDPIPQDEPKGLHAYPDKIVLPYSLDGYLWLVHHAADVIPIPVENWQFAVDVTVAIRSSARPSMALVLGGDMKTVARYGRAWLAGNRDGLVERTVEHERQIMKYVVDSLPVVGAPHD